MILPVVIGLMMDAVDVSVDVSGFVVGSVIAIEDSDVAITTTEATEISLLQKIFSQIGILLLPTPAMADTSSRKRKDFK